MSEKDTRPVRPIPIIWKSLYEANVIASKYRESGYTGFFKFCYVSIFNYREDPLEIYTLYLKAVRESEKNNPRK